MKALNPRLIVTSVSGYGQTGPYRDRPGFRNVAESIGGLRVVTGYPDRPPVRVGLAIGDSIAALFAAIGTLIALYHRDARREPCVPMQAESAGAHGPSQGQIVDVALYESIFSLLEGMLPEYVHEGAVASTDREPDVSGGSFQRVSDPGWQVDCHRCKQRLFVPTFDATDGSAGFSA